MNTMQAQAQASSLITLADFSLEQIEQLIASCNFRLNHDAHLNASDHSTTKGLAMELHRLATSKRNKLRQEAQEALQEAMMDRCPSCDEG